MHDHRDPQRVKGAARKLRSIDCRGRRKFVSEHMREVDAAALDHLSVRDDPGSAAASTGPLPLILGQLRGGILGQKFAQDQILQISQPGTHTVHAGGHDSFSSESSGRPGHR